jgi:hypothetical protein
VTPPTALEMCPTCDREGCAVAAAAALVASLTIPVTPGENGCACYGEFSRSHNPSRGCEIHGADGSVALEAAWSAERAAREDCHAHRVDWRARALAAEAELAGASAAICDVSDTIRRALDGDDGGMRAPYHGPLAVVLRYPSIAADLRRLDEVLTIGSPRAAAMRDDAVQWAKVAPLIERLRVATQADDDDPGDVNHALAALLAATEATP